MKKSDVRESLIDRDTLLITDAESGVKLRLPKLLLECFMKQLHNELITSPYDGGLLGAICANINYGIISGTMLCSLASTKILPMADHHK